MTKEQAKQKLGQYYEDGNWVAIAILLLRFGSELLRFLKELMKPKYFKVFVSSNDGPITLWVTKEKKLEDVLVKFTWDHVDLLPIGYSLRNLRAEEITEEVFNRFKNKIDEAKK